MAIFYIEKHTLRRPSAWAMKDVVRDGVRSGGQAPVHKLDSILARFGRIGSCACVCAYGARKADLV